MKISFSVTVTVLCVLLYTAWLSSSSVDSQCIDYGKPGDALLGVNKACPIFTREFADNATSTKSYCVDEMDAREYMEAQTCDPSFLCDTIDGRTDSNVVKLVKKNPAMLNSLDLSCFDGVCRYSKLGLGDTCAVGEQCSSTKCTGGVCARLDADEGAACAQGVQGACKSGLMCVGTCIKVLGNGAPCPTPAEVCNLDTFQYVKAKFTGKKSDEALICSSSTKTCVSAVSDVEEPCDPNAFPSCFEGLVCDAQSKTCKKLAAQGEACGSGCATGLACSQTTQKCEPMYCSASSPGCDCMCSDNDSVKASGHTGQCTITSTYVCRQEASELSKCLFGECVHSYETFSSTLSPMLCPMRKCKDQIIASTKCVAAYYKSIQSTYEAGKHPTTPPPPPPPAPSSPAPTKSVSDGHSSHQQAMFIALLVAMVAAAAILA